MNKQKCNESLARMAAVAPQPVSGCVRTLAGIVEGHITPVSTRLTTAIQSLRRAGVPVEEFVAAYGDKD